MELFLLRHGIAELRHPEIPDAGRKLTPKGEKQLRRVLETAKRSGVEPQLILTSPLRRAQQTAAIASELLDCSRIRETRALLPEASPERIWKELEDYLEPSGDVTRVLLAGHEPHLSSLLGFLMGAPMNVDFKKSALVRVTTRETRDHPAGVLKWILTPRLSR